MVPFMQSVRVLGVGHDKNGSRSVVRGRAGKLLVTAAALILPTQFGCPAPENKIAQLDPYTGDRPRPIQKQRQPYIPKNDYSMRPIPVQHRWPTNPMPAPTPAPAPPKYAGGEPGWMPKKGISERWRHIVIHHSADDKSTPAGMAAWHIQRGWDGLGYHFVIGNGVGYADGQVFVGERWPKQMHGAHCKTPGNEYNEHGIGICLIGDFDNHPPTGKQMQALARLVSYLSNQCGIPKSRINTHGGVTHKTACPGKYFNLQTVLRNVSTGPVTAGSK